MGPACAGASALIHLKRATKLQALMLDGTQVTDAGVVHLRDLTTLGVARTSVEHGHLTGDH